MRKNWITLLKHAMLNQANIWPKQRSWMCMCWVYHHTSPYALEKWGIKTLLQIRLFINCVCMWCYTDFLNTAAKFKTTVLTARAKKKYILVKDRQFCWSYIESDSDHFIQHYRRSHGRAVKIIPSSSEKNKVKLLLKKIGWLEQPVCLTNNLPKNHMKIHI